MFITSRSASVRTVLIAFAALALGAAASARSPQPAGAVAVQDSDVPHGIGSWDADAFGNHRAVIRVSAPAGAVFVHIPWRRPDAKPEDRHLIVVEGQSGGRILNVERIRITREYGDLVFEAPSAGDYFVYYLPNTGTGRANYPTVTYPAPQPTADPAWLKKHGLDGRNAGTWTPGSMPAASVVEFQAIEPLHSFFPMQVVATQGEVADLLARQPAAPFFVFAEDRTRPIKMATDLPLRWVRRGAGAPFSGEAMRGEFYPFQLGLFAARQDLAGVKVTFSGLTRQGGGGVIASSAFTCINLGGVDSAARPFTRALSVSKGHIQAIWCGVQVPEAAQAGDYAGAATVSAQGTAAVSVPLTVRVSPSVIPAHGDDEPWRLSRLRWLNSTMAVDDELVTPYIPVTVSGRTVGVLGRTVTLNALGFPEQIESRFAIEMTHLAEQARRVLTGPVALVVQSGDAAVTAWKGGGVTFTKQAPGAAAWAAKSDAGPLTMDTSAQMDFDGNVEFTVAVRASKATAVDDIRLEIPIAADVARFLMGLGFKGGKRPASLDWKWEVKNNQDSAWIGDINAGLQFTLKDDKYVRPLNTNFYTLKPLVMPASWFNGGKGGCRLAEKDAATYLVSCYSGARTIAPGDTLFYNFRLLLTPFKPIDPAGQFRTRYFHAFKPVDEVVQQGANVVNVHHANAINPYINYPFFRPAEMKAYIDRAHAEQLRVKIYYTVRELANRAPEIFALRSLGEEIFAPGSGGGYSWLQEHLGSNYIAAWFVPPSKDAAIVNSGVSRWHNFYVEGLDWLVATSASTASTLTTSPSTGYHGPGAEGARPRPAGRIDRPALRQPVQPADGFASSANLYLEHFPFIDRLWFGEYFDYNAAPDYWLVEMSGIPYGLMGEMLEGGGNPWRGMLFGMTNRLPWSGDPRALWQLGRLGRSRTRMIGFWVPGSTRAHRAADVLATVYQGEGRSIVAVASWAPDTARVQLAVDWTRLGLDPAKARITAPEIAGFQEGRSFDAAGPIPVEPGKGWLLVLQ